MTNGRGKIGSIGCNTLWFESDVPYMLFIALKICNCKVLNQLHHKQGIFNDLVYPPLSGSSNGGHTSLRIKLWKQEVGDGQCLQVHKSACKYF